MWRPTSEALCLLFLIPTLASCGPTTSDLGDTRGSGSRPPDFIMLAINDQFDVFLLGERNPRSLLFQGEIRHQYDSTHCEYTVTGSGTVTWRNHVIQIDPKSAKVNGLQLKTPEDGARSNYVLSANGTLEEGFVRTFD